MPTATSVKIVEKLDGICIPLGLSGFDAIELLRSRATNLFGNLATLLATLPTAADREQLVTQIATQTDTEQLKLLQLLTGIEADVLPMLKEGLGAFLQKLPSAMGRPRVIKDQNAEREVCGEILAVIGQGKSESEAKRIVAKTHEVSAVTISRIWNRRAELALKVDAVEFVSELLNKLASSQKVEWEINDPKPE